MGSECGTYGREQKWLQGFPGELERKRPLLGPGRRWENKIKTDLKWMEWEPWAWLTYLRIRTRGGPLRTR